MSRDFFVDAHAHLDSDLDRATAMVLDAESRGILGVFLGGYDPADWGRQIALRKKFGSRIQMSFGLHPWFIHNATDDSCADAFETLREFLRNDKDNDKSIRPAAVGETGLDHALAQGKDRQKNSSYLRQAQWFERHLELASTHSMPVVLHVVKAHGTALEILKAHSLHGGLVHAFRGDKSLALQYSALGILVSIGPNGIASMSPRDLADIPDQSLVIESDAPTGAMGSRQRGATPITPGIIMEVATEVAVARGKNESAAQILALSRTNLERTFGFNFSGFE